MKEEEKKVVCRRLSYKRREGGKTFRHFPKWPQAVWQHMASAGKKEQVLLLPKIREGKGSGRPVSPPKLIKSENTQKKRRESSSGSFFFCADEQ